MTPEQARFFNVIFSHECIGTHHKLALDAVGHLRNPDACTWIDNILYYYDTYLDGSEAPDKQFQDFKNHVLYVQDDDWGGAIPTAQHWYKKSLAELRRGAWPDAIYSMGVLSHYFTDLIMPFQTGQTAQAGNIHRAVEWSVRQSFDHLRDRTRNQEEYPDIEIPDSQDWLAEMMRQGARYSHTYYQLILDHYDLKAARSNPTSALDEELQAALAELLAYATIGFARILDHFFAEAEVTPPPVNIHVARILTQLTTPIAWLTRKLSDHVERKIAANICHEVQATGRASKTLPQAERLVREAHAKEILGIPLDELDQQTVPPTGQLHGRMSLTKAKQRLAHQQSLKPSRVTKTQERRVDIPHQGSPAEPVSKNRRCPVDGTSALIEVPFIGRQAVQILETRGIHNVAQFIALDVQQVVQQCAPYSLDPKTIQQWQIQLRLVSSLPNLDSHGAQILVGCGFTSVAEIADATSADMTSLLDDFRQSDEGSQLLQSGRFPDTTLIRDWIHKANEALQSKAA